MANYKVPPFLKRGKDSLLYNEEGQLYYIIPEKFFETKCAAEYGQMYQLIGVFNYVRVSKAGDKIGRVKPFNFPTMFMCKPSSTEPKVSGTELNKKFSPSEKVFDGDSEYRLLIFSKGDTVVHTVHVPESVDHVEEFFRIMFITAKISNTISYDRMHEYFDDSIQLNGNDYGINAQMYGVILSELCRDKDDVSIPFRNGKNIDKSMHAYKPIPITQNPNYIDPFVSITSQYWDESLMSAVMLDHSKGSPLEKVMTT